jgi:ABC-type antimicrobial peptide transport system permease subunit
MVNGWQFDFYFPLPTAIRLVVGVVLLAGLAGTFPAWLATRRHPTAEEIPE